MEAQVKDVYDAGSLIEAWHVFYSSQSLAVQHWLGASTDLDTILQGE